MVEVRGDWINWVNVTKTNCCCSPPSPALKGCRPRAVHTVQPLCRLSRARPTLYKRTGGELACLQDS